jgi:hypothetical protein
MKTDDQRRIGRDPWVDYLEGRNAGFPETVLKRDLDSITRRIAAMQKDVTSPETRLADNAMEFNPAAVGGVVQLMWGALVPGREGSLLSARLRYFDPVRRRAGVPDDVGALVSELRDDRTVVTLVNVSPTTPRTVIVQGGGYGEHQILSADVNGRTTPINARDFTVRLAPGAGAKVTLAMKRYANPPTAKFPWDR